MSQGIEGHHITGSHEEPCWHCGDPTDQIEIHFEAYLCQGACTAAKEGEFWEAVRTRPQDFEDPFETTDERNHRMYKDYVRLTGQPPPRTQHPNNTLPDKMLEKLRERPDLVDWALGRG